jgi:hypothetical protein
MAANTDLTQVLTYIYDRTNCLTADHPKSAICEMLMDSHSPYFRCSAPAFECFSSHNVSHAPLFSGTLHFDQFTIIVHCAPTKKDCERYAYYQLRQLLLKDLHRTFPQQPNNNMSFADLSQAESELIVLRAHVDDMAKRLSYIEECFALFASYFQPVIDAFGTTNALADAWNKLMHSINGNPKHFNGQVIEEVVADTSKNPFVKKVKKTKPQKQKMRQNLTIIEKPVRLTKMVPTMRKAAKANRGNPFMSKMSQAIAANILLPGEQPVVRIKTSVFDENKTAVAKPFLRLNLGWTGTGTFNSNSNNPANISSSDYPIWLFRDYLRHAIIFDPNVNVGLEVGQFAINPNTSVSTSLNPQLPTTNSPTAFILAGETINVPVQYIDYSQSTYKPHGTILYSGTTDGFEGSPPFFFAHAADVINTAIYSSAAVTATSQIVIGLNFFDGSTVRENTANKPNGTTSAGGALVNFGSGTTSQLVITQTGYYSLTVYSQISTQLTFNVGTSTTPTVNFNIVGSGGVRFGHRSLRDFNLNSGSVTSTSIYGTSLLYTNTAPKDGRAGEFAFLQSPSSIYWLSYAANGYSSVATADNAYSTDITDGAFYPLFPTEIESLEPKQYHTISNGNLLSSHYPLVHKDEYIVFWASVPSPASATSLNPQSAQITISDSISYSTIDTWRETAPPVGTPDDLKNAILAVRRTPQGHRNPVHLREIWNSILGGARKFTGIARNVIGKTDDFVTSLPIL